MATRKLMVSSLSSDRDAEECATFDRLWMKHAPDSRTRGVLARSIPDGDGWRVHGCGQNGRCSEGCPHRARLRYERRAGCVPDCVPAAVVRLRHAFRIAQLRAG